MEEEEGEAQLMAHKKSEWKDRSWEGTFCYLGVNVHAMQGAFFTRCILRRRNKVHSHRGCTLRDWTNPFRACLSSFHTSPGACVADVLLALAPAPRPYSCPFLCLSLPSVSAQAPHGVVMKPFPLVGAAGPTCISHSEKHYASTFTPFNRCTPKDITGDSVLVL